MKKLKKYWLIITLLLIACGAWFLGLHKYLDIELLKANHEALVTYIVQNPLLSISIYSVTYILVVALSIPGATIMTIAGGLLFGQVTGTISVVISATLGASVLFIAARMASQDLLQQKNQSWVRKMKEGFNKDAFFYLLTMRLIPLFPFVAINLVAAILQISFRTFFVGTLIGIIPGSFVYVSMGVALQDIIIQTQITPQLILNPKVIIALTGLGILSMLPIIYRIYQRRKENKS